MIVDSDLGNLDSYNARKTPVIRDDLLPENAQLIYASRNAGKENIFNRTLAIADSSSGSAWQRFKAKLCHSIPRMGIRHGTRLSA
ncbi:hypothetical protein FDV58_39230 [Bradyrhizobium elkanii]|uniref:Uncharacterized protein n=1 Tax=Bradyrhizobium elkanii TaxID=29448 RepID=A0A4U6RCA8_BRAEL|nr:hypothetical protein [Bradyrhizobium elkanii]TKV71654.1 hypothetical protein FDV58_39230 [Bradyrhizobium elkanii]